MSKKSKNPITALLASATSLPADVERQLFELARQAHPEWPAGHIAAIIAHLTPDLAAEVLKSPQSFDWEANQQALIEAGQLTPGTRTTFTNKGTPVASAAAGDPTLAVQPEVVAAEQAGTPASLIEQTPKTPKTVAPAGKEAAMGKQSALAAVIDDIADELDIPPSQAAKLYKNLPPDLTAKLQAAAQEGADEYAKVFLEAKPAIQEVAGAASAKVLRKPLSKAEQAASAAVVKKIAGLGLKTPMESQLGKIGTANIIQALLSKTPKGKKPVPAAVAPAAVPEDLKALLSTAVPSDRKDLTKQLMKLVKGKELSLKDAKNVSRLADAGVAEGRTIDEMLATLSQGRAVPKGVSGKGGKAVDFVKSFLGLGGNTGMSKAYQAEEALAKAGVAGFAGKAAKAGRLGRELLRPGISIPAALLALTGIGAAGSRKAVNEIEATPIVSAEEIQRRLEMNQKLAARHVRLAEDPETMNDVIRVLAGGSPTRLTPNEVEIGRVQQKRKPDEVQAMLNQLLFGLEQVDSVNVPSGFPF